MTKRANKPIAVGDMMWRVYAGIAVAPVDGVVKAIIGCLVDHADKDGKAWPSVQTMAELLDISKRTIERHIGKLAPYARIIPVSRTRNSYQVDFDALLREWDSYKQRQETRLRRIKKLPSNVTVDGEATTVKPEGKLPSMLTGPLPSKVADDQKQIPVTTTSASFDAFWKVYPRHVAKKAAQRAFGKILQKREATYEELVQGAKRYAQECEGRERHYIKHATNWLNGGCWSDEVEPKQPRAYRNGDRWMVEPGSEEFAAWRSYYKRQNSSSQYSFTKREPKAVSVSSRWPPNR